MEKVKFERNFQNGLINEIKTRLPGSIVMKTDPTYIQGFPDLLILYNDRWAALEVKVRKTAPLRPNQAYYVDLLDELSFASFIFPENKEEVLYALQRSFESGGVARVSVGE